MEELDQSKGFVLHSLHGRGRLVRLGPVMEQVLANHDYPPAIARVVAEGLLLVALLGSLLKGEGSQLTMQAQTENGAVSLLVVDYLDGAVRGYAQYDAEKLALLPAQPSLFALFGTGYLAITFDQSASKERYQGIVPLEGSCLSDAVEHYFVQSEQIPTLVRTGFSADGRKAGALLLQHLPDGEEGRERLHVRLDDPEWDHLRAHGETIKAEELSDSSLSLDDIVWRLFHEEPEIRVFEPVQLTKGCRCNPERIRSVIAQFSHEERVDMAADNGKISVDCAFCNTAFPLELTSFLN
jgi:molecular chaperone Hsp33